MLFFFGGSKRCAPNENEVKLPLFLERDTGYETYVPEDLGCIDISSAYHPVMRMSTVQINVTSVPEDDREIEAIRACQNFCQSTAGCRHFNFFAQSMTCNLADAGAFRQHPVIDAVSGPASCTLKGQANRVGARRNPFLQYSAEGSVKGADFHSMSMAVAWGCLTFISLVVVVVAGSRHRRPALKFLARDPGGEEPGTMLLQPEE